MMKAVTDTAFGRHCFAPNFDDKSEKVKGNRASRSYSIAIYFTFGFSLFTFALANAQPAPQITGATSVCQGAVISYTTDWHAGHTWSWSVSPGGVITQNSGNFISVQWSGAPNSTQSVSVIETDPVGAQGSDLHTVFIKNNLLTCGNQINISIDQTGATLIEPQMLLTGNYNSYEGFTVQVSEWGGAVIGNTLTCNHVGLQLIGMVTDDCSGNSCWSTILLEDKNAPVWQCPTAPVEIPCDAVIDDYPQPLVTDNCDANLQISLVGISVDNGDLCSGVLVTKSWKAVDEYGNYSFCTQILHVNPNIGLDFPKDTSWTCEQYAAFPNITNPTPVTDSIGTTGSGVPSSASGPYCPYSYVYADDTIAACGSTFKILRTWTVFNWCNGQIITEDLEGDDNEQIIKILDTKKPVVTVPPVVLGANVKGAHASLCASTELLPPPSSLTDNCSAVTLRIFTPVGEAIYVNGTDGKQGGYVPSPGLKIGWHTVVYKATDACGNSTELLVPVQVVDNKVPIAVCDELTDVNLDQFGYAEVFAETFDDGSHDNCCLDHFAVRRMDEPDAPFLPSVIFTCSDDTVQVILRVYDCFDNYNECMVLALVHDKKAPKCIPPPQKVVSCTDIAPDVTSDWLNATYGTANTYDNCGAQIAELPFHENINNCGQGHILRSWAAVDPSGNVSATCSQYIYVEPKSDWVIHFPPDWAGGCGDTIAAPKIQVQNFACDLLATTYEDQYFFLGNDSACYKIVRTWKVINWCSYDPAKPAILLTHHPLGLTIDETSFASGGRFEYQQIIKIHDDTPPVLSYPFYDEFCSYDASCITGHVFLPLQIDGECSDDFTIIYHLDLKRDLSYDSTGTGFYDGYLPLGNHRILYIVEDGCGNSSQIVVDFVVKDCKPPVAICKNGLIVEIMQTGMIEICAESLDYGSYDNCPGDLIISFSADTSDQCRIFLCNQTYLDLPIEIWVTDAAGNQAHCETTIFIQDNMFHCDSNLPIQGKISDWKQQAVAGVKVQLNGTMGSFDFLTGADGNYAFQDLEEGDYTVAPFKNSDPLNGVTTFDLVLISRHILSIDKLASPFQIIAADANHSGSVTTFDLVALRKLVLFIEDELPGNTSWRFVPKSFQFPNPNDPWQTPFPEVLNFNNLDQEVSDAHFVAIKVGDINGNANPNNLGSTNEDRNSQSPLLFGVDEQVFQANETVRATFRARDFRQIAGFQFTLVFDRQQLEFQKIVTEDNLLGQENFGVKNASEGKLTASWYEPHPVTLADSSALFTVEFLAKKTGNLSLALQLNSSLTDVEAYQGEALNIRGIGLAFQPTGQANGTPFQLYQNVPNPFLEKTTIGFSLPEACHATLTVFDATGKTVLAKADDFTAGYHEITLDRQMLPPSGVLFYRLETQGNAAVKTMQVGD